MQISNNYIRNKILFFTFENISHFYEFKNVKHQGLLSHDSGR